jgi:hypothetical protein
MKFINTALFIIISVVFSGCSASIDRWAGVIHTSSFLGDMSHGYTEHSGLTIINPHPELRMRYQYAVFTRMLRVEERHGMYPVTFYEDVEVYRSPVKEGLMGENVTIPPNNLTNHNYILRVTVSFYDKDGYVDEAKGEFYTYFYRGVWKESWSPRPRH